MAEEAPPLREMASKAWSTETLNAALVTVAAQQCKHELDSTPDSSGEKRIKDPIQLCRAPMQLPTFPHIYYVCIYLLACMCICLYIYIHAFTYIYLHAGAPGPDQARGGPSTCLPEAGNYEYPCQDYAFTRHPAGDEKDPR